MNNEMMNFYKSALLGLASDKPLCNEYKNEWRACGDDKEKLLTFSLRQQCIPYVMLYSYKGYGLSREYLKSEYGKLINGLYTAKNSDMVQGYTYGLCVDLKRQYTQNTDICSYMYCNNSFVLVPLTKCPSLFVGCKSDIHVSMDGYNSIRIYLYDESKVTIDDCDKDSDVTVYRYSNDANVEIGRYCLGKVKVFDKELKTQL